MIKIFKFKSIGSKLTFWIFFALTCLIGIRTVIAVDRQIKDYESMINHDLDLQLSLGEAALKTALWDMNEDNIDSVLTFLIQEKTVIKAEILEANGAFLISKTKSGMDHEAAFLRVKEKGIVYSGQLLGRLKLTSSVYLYRVKMVQQILREIIFALTTILLIGILIKLLTHQITQSITALSEVAREIEHGNYEAQFTVCSSDEVGQLSNSLSAMQKQIIDNLIALEQDRMEIEALYEETAAMNEELNYTLDLVNQNYEETLQTLANAIEANDYYTKGHCERVKTYAVELGKQAGLDAKELLKLSRAAILHDIGKIGVPSTILNKILKLTDEEFAIIKEHSRIGSQILNDVNFLVESIPIVLQHHERYDGTGYPLGLKGDEINLLARILSIADSFDAMTTSRAYRKIPLSFEAAMAQLIAGSGSQFDPELVSLFQTYLKDRSAFL